MPHIEPSLARFLQRMVALRAFFSMRCSGTPWGARGVSSLSTPAGALDVDVSRAALGGPGWYDSSWDLIQGLVVHESTAAGATRLDDASPCWLA